MPVKYLMENLELIVFDLDGVLVSSKQMYLYAFQKALEKVGYNRSYKEIEPKLGQKVRKVISDLIPPDDKERESKIETATKYCDEICSTEEGMEKVVSLGGAKEAAKELSKKYILSIVTNSDRIFVETILKKFSLDNYWKKIIAADDGFESKEDAINYLIQFFGTTPEKTTYIADMAKDMDIAKKVGCRIIAIPGWHNEKKLKEALDKHGYSEQNLIRSLKELM